MTLGAAGVAGWGGGVVDVVGVEIPAAGVGGAAVAGDIGHYGLLMLVYLGSVVCIV